MFTSLIFEIWGSYRIEIGQNFKGYPHAEFQRSLENVQNSKKNKKGRGTGRGGSKLRKFDYTSLALSISYTMLSLYLGAYQLSGCMQRLPGRARRLSGHGGVLATAGQPPGRPAS